MKVAIIGAGNMGGAIARGLAQGHYVKASEIIVTNPSTAKLDKLKAEFPDIHTSTNNKDAADADVVVVAVKPWKVEEVLKPLRLRQPQILVSVAAGLTFENLAHFVDPEMTIFRVILIVPFIILLLGGQAGWFGDNTFVTDMIALAIFIIASLTDLIDGKIARKYNLITDFGKFMDPLADKLLVCSAMIALIEMNRIPSWVVIIIIAREFIISGFRLIASDNGVVIAASYWGKFKTTFQMVMICLMIANFPQLQILTDIIMWIALILTVVSLIDYLVKNKDVMKDTK